MIQQSDIIQSILKDSNYHLALFSEDDIDGLRVVKNKPERDFLTCSPHFRLVDSFFIF